MPEGASWPPHKSKIAGVLPSDTTQSKFPTVEMNKLRPREGKKLAQGPTESLKQPEVKSRPLAPTVMLHPWLKKFKKA